MYSFNNLHMHGWLTEFCTQYTQYNIQNEVSAETSWGVIIYFKNTKCCSSPVAADGAASLQTTHPHLINTLFGELVTKCRLLLLLLYMLHLYLLLSTSILYH